MAAATVNLPVVEKGSTYRHSLTWKDSSNIPINLIGASARMQIRESYLSTSPLIELNTFNGRITISPGLGKIDLYISAEDTTTLEGIGGIYDLEVIFTSGDITRLIEGKIIFKPEVTR
jgi:hypothetical protein